MNPTTYVEKCENIPKFENIFSMNNHRVKSWLKVIEQYSLIHGFHFILLKHMNKF
jgi:predicted transcriptional regulator